jgi:hypothetical protein
VRWLARAIWRIIGPIALRVDEAIDDLGRD